MKKFAAIAAAVATLAASVAAFAVQQTFTTMGSASCTSTLCTQETTDGSITMEFPNTTPSSGPTTTGFLANGGYVDIEPTAPNTLVDMSILVLTINSSTFFNGAFYVGSVVLQTYDPATATWNDVAGWSMQVGKSKYILLNGSNLSQPKIQNAAAIRLVGINGTTAFTVNMANLTPHQ
jgi:hypothetical protein